MKQSALLPEEVYEQIKRNTPSDLDTRVLLVFTANKGVSLSRVKLVEVVFNVKLPFDVNLSNLHIDRMIRKSIKKLAKIYPIVGDSGKGGYMLATNAAPIYKMIAENTSRVAALSEANRQLELIAQHEFGGMVPLPGMVK